MAACFAGGVLTFCVSSNVPFLYSAQCY